MGLHLSLRLYRLALYRLVYLGSRNSKFSSTFFQNSRCYLHPVTSSPEGVRTSKLMSGRVSSTIWLRKWPKGDIFSVFERGDAKERVVGPLGCSIQILKRNKRLDELKLSTPHHVLGLLKCRVTSSENYFKWLLRTIVNIYISFLMNITFVNTTMNTFIFELG